MKNCLHCGQLIAGTSRSSGGLTRPINSSDFCCQRCEKEHAAMGFGFKSDAHMKKFMLSRWGCLIFPVAWIIIGYIIYKMATGITVHTNF